MFPRIVPTRKVYVLFIRNDPVVANFEASVVFGHLAGVDMRRKTSSKQINSTDIATRVIPV